MLNISLSWTKIWITVKNIKKLLFQGRGKIKIFSRKKIEHSEVIKGDFLRFVFFRLTALVDKDVQM